MDKDLVTTWISTALNTDFLGAIYIDIDNLQAHNDCFGHVIGDETIEKITKQIKQIVKTYDGNFARVAGDEFLIILDSDKALTTFDVADSIKSSIDNLNIKLVDKINWYPDQAQHYPDNVTISIGAFIKKNDKPYYGCSETVISLAEASCVFAKFSGKNRIVKIDLRK